MTPASHTPAQPASGPRTFAEQYAFAKSVMASASKPAGKMMLSRMLRGNPYIKESSGVQSA